MRRLLPLGGAFALALSLAITTTAEAGPEKMVHQGRMLNAGGTPLDGANSVSFTIFDAPAGGSALWAETQTIEFDNGFYTVELGKLVPFNTAIFDGSPMYLGLAVNGGAPLPTRIPIASVPFAFHAGTATNVKGGVVDATEIRVNGTTVIDSSGVPALEWGDIQGLPSGFADGVDDVGSSLPSCDLDQIVKFDGSGWSCADADGHVHDAADIGSGTVDVDRLPVGDGADQVAAGDHAHQKTGLDALSCSEGEIAKFVSGSWDCTADGGGGAGSLLVNFDLDESSGTSFADTSGGGNNAKTSGGGLAAGSAGHSGRGINFSGGVVTVASGNTIVSSPYVTVDAWIQPALPLTGTRVIATKEGAWTIRQKAAVIEFTITAANGSCTVTSPYSVKAGEWASVSGSYDGRSVAVAVDDSWYDGACAKGPLANTTGKPLDIGADNTSGSPASPYAGIIDEVRVWSTASNRNFGRYGRAVGGDISDISGKRIHTFNQSGTFTAYAPLVVDVLLVGGGGGGGQHNTTNANGGGGGGGVVQRSSFAVDPGIYTVTVGAGGGAVLNSGNRQGLDGGDSVFSTLTAKGGGGGGGSGAGPGRNGGSGGGGAYPNGHGGANTPGNGTSGQGNSGGYSNYTWTGGGGGGAGGPGVNGNACGNCNPSGNGGPGVSSSISGTTKYYGGGGGGGGNSSERAGDGFDGGGRGHGTTTYYSYNLYVDEVNGSTRGHGIPDGIPNTGGGGGGGSYWSPNIGWWGAGRGGSGVVIIRYDQ